MRRWSYTPSTGSSGGQISNAYVPGGSTISATPNASASTTATSSPAPSMAFTTAPGSGWSSEASSGVALSPDTSTTTLPFSDVLSARTTGLKRMRFVP